MGDIRYPLRDKPDYRLLPVLQARECNFEGLKPGPVETWSGGRASRLVGCDVEVQTACQEAGLWRWRVAGWRTGAVARSSAGSDGPTVEFRVVARHRNLSTIGVT
jgi:hypothetical protein